MNITSYLYTSQSKSLQPPPPQPGKGGDIDLTEELEKKEPMSPTPGQHFHFNGLDFPRLPVKVYAEVPIFIWFKMFQTSLVFNFFIV